MYQKDAEVLFPMRVIAALRDLRGEGWQMLVERVRRLPENDVDVLAFGLLMIRLGGCLSCQADSYRAMRGCTFCARQTVIRFKGTDDELIQMWDTARIDVLTWIRTGHLPTHE
ncbi:MAG: hypothetical protein JXQ72_07000 [Anaerolineae bacterium]|nr:hypothetical protein [Anaerolineae bacterium]